MKWIGLGIVAVGMMLGCATRQPNPPPARLETDPMIAQWTANAQQAYDRGTIAQAVTLYQMALERATMADDSAAIGQIAYALATCEATLGNLEQARASLMTAERALKRSGSSTAEAVLLDASLARRLGDMDTAADLLGSLPFRDLSIDQNIQANLLRALVACDRNQLSEAEGYLAAAESLLPKKPAPLELARLHEVAGRLYTLSNRLPLAADHYDQQALMLRKAGHYREMADALNRSGDVWMQMNKVEQAGDRYYRAARSFMAQGDSIAALQVIDKVVSLDREGLEDSDVMREIASLFEEIKNGIAVPTPVE